LLFIGIFCNYFLKSLLNFGHLVFKTHVKLLFKILSLKFEFWLFKQVSSCLVSLRPLFSHCDKSKQFSKSFIYDYRLSRGFWKSVSSASSLKCIDFVFIIKTCPKLLSLVFSSNVLYILCFLLNSVKFILFVFLNSSLFLSKFFKHVFLSSIVQ